MYNVDVSLDSVDHRSYKAFHILHNVHGSLDNVHHCSYKDLCILHNVSDSLNSIDHRSLSLLRNLCFLAFGGSLSRYRTGDLGSRDSHVVTSSWG